MFPELPAANALRALALSAASCVLAPASAQEFSEFSTRGLPRSQGVVVRVSHPAQWKRVVLDDPMALAELRGTQGKLTGILQIGRGLPRRDIATACAPERARTMLQGIGEQEPDALVTEVFARTHQGRPAFELRYDRRDAPGFLRVRSLVVCLKDSKLVVSCGASADAKATLAEIEPVCRRVLESVVITEE
jgi:hypothetical protein